MQKILVADDEMRIRMLVCDFLKKEGYETIEAGDGQEALDEFEKNRDTALIILDIMMPEVDGWEACRRIREVSDVPIIMLTARSEEFDQLMGFEAGADDYVTKPFSPKVLVMRIAALLKRSAAEKQSSSKLTLDGLKIDEEAHEVYLNDKLLDLTLKEYDIILKLMSSTGRVFKREQLLDSIWGYDYTGDTRTVDSHVARLRTKLGDWGSEHLKTVYGIGYKIEIPNIES